MLLTACLALLTGCLFVRSVYPFYTDSLLVEKPEFNGEWQAFEYFDLKKKNENSIKWVINGDKAVVTEKGKDAEATFEMLVKHFEVGGILYADMLLNKFNDDALGLLSSLHMYPVHTLWKVKAENDKLKYLPLSDDWFMEALKAGTVDLPYESGVENSGLLIVTAKSDKLVAFLEEYGAIEEVFNTKEKIVLERVN